MIALVLAGCSDAPADKPEPPEGGIAVSLVAEDDDVLDAVPDAAGERIWFLAAGGDRLCRVDGSDVACADGDLGGRGLVLTTDDDTLLVGTGGGLVALAVADVEAAFGAALPTGEVVAGTEAVAASALALDGALDVVFAGDDGAPGVWTVPVAGGSAERVATVDAVPSGVAVSRAGRVVLAGPAADGTGGVSVVHGGVADELVSGLDLGDPAGIALTPDGASAMVSSHSAAGTSQVAIVAGQTGEVSIFDDVISENDASGGLHPSAGGGGHYAWAGRTGKVYAVVVPVPVVTSSEEETVTWDR